VRAQRGFGLTRSTARSFEHRREREDLACDHELVRH
jgi:hypothetical protein